MPADFFIDTQRGVVFSKAVGVFSRADVQDHMERLLRHPAFLPAFNQLVDFREVTKFALSGEEIAELAMKTVFSPLSKRALVVSSDEHYGLSRMIGTYREIGGEPGMKVFRQMDAALSWLCLSAAPDSGSFPKLRAVPDEKTA